MNVLSVFRKDAEVSMDGQFLVRQIYEDEITYNLIHAAVDVLSKYQILFKVFTLYRVKPTARISSCFYKLFNSITSHNAFVAKIAFR